MGTSSLYIFGESLICIHKTARLVALVFVFVKQEIFFGGIIGPNIFDTVINVPLILYFLQIFQYFKWSP